MAGSKILALRQGTPHHKIIEIRGVKMAVVMLPSDVIRKIEERVEQYAQANRDKVNENVRNQYYDQLLVYECLRDDSELTRKVAENVSEISETFDTNEIRLICSTYGDLMIASDPNKIELLTQEQLDELKKHLEVTPLSDLNTVLLVHLSNCHQAMHLEI